MKHIRLFLLTIFCLVSMTAFAYADPISVAIVGALGITSTFGVAVATTALDLAFAAGLSYVEQAIVGKQKTNTTGNSGKLSTGGTVGRTFMVGVGQTAGSLAYVGTWGKASKTPNAYCTFVIPLSDLPVTSIEELWIDNVKITLPDMSGAAPYDQGWAISEYNKPSGNNHLWIRFYDGTQTTADSFLVDTFGSSTDRPWADTAVGTGISYAIITCQADSSLFSGFPQFNFVLKGIPVYSIRKDSTNGGSGSHRWNDPSTWEWSENAADITYTVLRGLSYDGYWFYGMQSLSQNRLPYAEWSAAASKCDVTITNADDTTEAQYRCGGEIPIGTQLSDTVTDLLTSCNGRLSESGGIYKLRVGSAGSSVASITDGDIISTEDQTFSPIISLSDKINGLTAKYPEPNQMWAQYDAPPLYNADYEAQDGNRRLATDITYNLVPYQRQVQRLMASAVAEHRRARNHTLMLPPWAYVLEPGDVISWTSARNGYDGKLFRVDQIADQPNCDIQVQITEVDPTDYDWDSATDEKPVSYGSLTINVPPLQLMTGWNAAPYTIPDNDGTGRRPAIKVNYDGDLDDVQFVRVQVRLADETDLQFDGTSPYGDPATNADPSSVVVNFSSITPNTEYEVRGIYLPYSSRDTIWSNETESGGIVTEGAWLTVTTPNVQFTTDDIKDDAITTAKILAAAVTELKLADASVATAKLQVAAVTADILASGSVTNTKIADAAVGASKIADQAVTLTKFASGITPIEIGGTLPATGNFAGRQFYNTADGKLYRYNGSAWTSATAASDINGQITASQIADAAVTASKLADQAVTLTKFASGLAPVETGGALPTTGNFTGRIFFLTSDSLIYRWNGVWTNYVAASTIAGTLTDSQIASISAAKLTGQITGTQITDGAISTPKIAAGAVTAATIAANTITASQIAAATITATELASGSVTTTKLAAGSVTAAAIAANSITSGMIQAGAVSTTQLAAGSVTAGIIGANAVTTDKIAANSITASKLVLTDFSNIIPDDQMIDPSGWTPLNSGWVHGTNGALWSNGYWYYTPQGTGSFGHGLQSSLFPIDQSKTYYFSLATSGLSTGEYTLLYRVQWFDYTGSALSQSTIGQPTYNAQPPNRISNNVTPPAGALSAVVQIYVYEPTTTTAQIYVGGPVGRVMANAELIVDGSITTAKLVSGSVTTDILAAGAVTAAKITANSITAGQIAAGAIGTTQLAAGAVTAGIIAADAVTTDKLAANSVTASKLVLTDFSNIVPDSQMMDPSGWAPSGAGWTYIAAGVAASRGYWKYSAQGVSGYGAGLNSQLFPIDQSKTYYFSVIASGDTAGNYQLFARVTWYNSAGAYISESAITNVSASYQPPTGYSNTFTPPGGALTAIVQFYIYEPTTTTSNVYINDVSGRVMANAELIVDGSITALKIGANSVTAAAIAAGSVTSAAIAAGAVTADKITVASLAALGITVGSADIEDAAISSPKTHDLSIEWLEAA